MLNSYRLYLDVCCLNRPFDDWQQERVRFEGEAVLSILERVRDNRWVLIGSAAIDAELQRLSNPDKLANVLNLKRLESDRVVLDDATNESALKLEKLGFGLYDAFHIAYAEKAQADVLLTTDDRLLRRAIRYKDDIRVQLNNPVNWLMKVLSAEQDSENDAN